MALVVVVAAAAPVVVVVLTTTASSAAAAAAASVAHAVAAAAAKGGYLLPFFASNGCIANGLVERHGRFPLPLVLRNFEGSLEKKSLKGLASQFLFLMSCIWCCGGPKTQGKIVSGNNSVERQRLSSRRTHWRKKDHRHGAGSPGTAALERAAAKHRASKCGRRQCRSS